MAKRSGKVGRDAPSGSTRDWLAGGIAWEVETALTAVPVVIVTGLVALLFDVSFTVVIVVAVVVALAVRLVVDSWRRLTSTDPARSSPPHEDM